MSANRDQQHPERVDFEEIIQNENYPPWPAEIVSTWRKGSQLRHAMETESAVRGHQQGAQQFLHLLQHFEQEHMRQVYPHDIEIILEIITTFDMSDMLAVLLRHPYLSAFLRANKEHVECYNNHDNEDEVDDDGAYQLTSTQSQTTFKPLQTTLKKAIRTGKIRVLNYLINQDIIPIQLFDDEHIDSKQFEADLKSLLYNILRAVEIASKKRSETTANCMQCARQFWPYLATKVNDLKQAQMATASTTEKEEKQQLDDNQALKQLIQCSEQEENEKDSVLIANLKAMNEDALIIKYISLFLKTMVSKKMNNEQMVAILRVLQFQRERYITFEDRANMKDTDNAWKHLSVQLMDDYLRENPNMSDAIDWCIELEMIEYLVSGGVDIECTDKKATYLQQTIQRGKNSWNLRSCSDELMQQIMPHELPLELKKLIVHMLCL